MESSSLGSPLMTLATFSFAIILSFSSSVVLSQPSSKNHPSPVHRHPPPSPKDSHLLHAPRPLKGNWNHPPHRPWHPLDKKHGELVKSKNRGLNKGKLVGLLFAGVFVVMQIGVGGFGAAAPYSSLPESSGSMNYPLLGAKQLSSGLPRSSQALRNSNLIYEVTFS